MKSAPVKTARIKDLIYDVTNASVDKFHMMLLFQWESFQTEICNIHFAFSSSKYIEMHFHVKFFIWEMVKRQNVAAAKLEYSRYDPLIS